MRRTAALAVCLLAIVLASRAPFAAHTLWAHDSVLYANALERGFHVDDELLLQRPHPPGYILYVAAASVARAAGLGSNDALILVSALASALTAAGIFLLARRFASERVALIVALAYAADPLVWQYSEIAYPYTVLGLASIVVAAAFLWARGRSFAAMAVASLVFAVAGGFRQDVLLLLGPLWLWSAAPLGWRRAAAAALVVAVGCLAWLVPTMALSGGPVEYLRALTGQAEYVRDTYSVTAQGTPALIANLLATGYAAGWALLAVAPLAVAGILARRERPRDVDGLLIWSLPPLALYVVLHIGDWGYVLSAAPGLYVLAALGLARALPRLPRPRLALAGVSGSLVLVPALVFIQSSAPFSRTAVAAHDETLSTHVAYVRDNFTPRSTLIITREDFMLVRYYLPEFRSRQYDPDPYTRSTRRMRTRGVERVVVMTEGLVPERPRDVRRVQCRRGIELVYLDVTPGAILEFHGERYTVASGAP